MKVGNRVTVYRKVEKPPSPWVSYMKYTVGLSGVVDKIEAGDALVTLDGESSPWWFPLSTLKYEVSK